MPIKMIRIDDRLIHGQICAAWVKTLDITRIWIIDDGTAHDDFLKNVMALVAPSNTELVITGCDKISELAKDYDNENKNTLVLAKYPYVAKELFMTGIEHKSLNVGGMGASPDRKKLYKNISASDEELKTLDELVSNNVDVYFQVTPDEKRIAYTHERKN